MDPNKPRPPERSASRLSEHEKSNDDIQPKVRFSTPARAETSTFTWQRLGALFHFGGSNDNIPTSRNTATRESVSDSSAPRLKMTRKSPISEESLDASQEVKSNRTSSANLNQPPVIVQQTMVLPPARTNSLMPQRTRKGPPSPNPAQDPRVNSLKDMRNFGSSEDLASQRVIRANTDVVSARRHSLTSGARPSISLNKKGDLPRLGAIESSEWKSFINFRTAPQEPKSPDELPKARIDELLDQGLSAFYRHNLEEAGSKWHKAQEMVLFDGDIYREIRILSNLACIARQKGKFAEALEQLIKAWLKLYLIIHNTRRKKKNGIVWLDLVTSLFSESLHSEYATKYPRLLPSKSEEMLHVPKLQSPNDSKLEEIDLVHSPAIVILSLHLSFNIANAYFSLNEIPRAREFYTRCVESVQTTLQHCPLPGAFQHDFMDEIKANEKKMMSPITPISPSKSSVRLKLSQLHRAILLTYSRSMSQLAHCSILRGEFDQAVIEFDKSRASVDIQKAQSTAQTFIRRSSLSSSVANTPEHHEALVISGQAYLSFIRGNYRNAIRSYELARKKYLDLGLRFFSIREDANLGCVLIAVSRFLEICEWVDSKDHRVTSTGCTYLNEYGLEKVDTALMYAFEFKDRLSVIQGLINIGMSFLDD